MLTGHEFRQLPQQRPRRKTDTPPNDVAFLTLLHERVIERFARVSDLSAIVIPLDLPGHEQADAPHESPNHSVCAEFAHTDYCRDSWQWHLTQLNRHPKTHWHICDHDRCCAVVPVVCRDRCFAAVSLVCPNSIPERFFEARVEILDILVNDFVTSEDDFLARLLPPEQLSAESKAAAPRPIDTPPGDPPTHWQVLRAIEYIEKHFTEPKLTLGHIARKLDVHPDYLSRLFAKNAGQRINQYISARRIKTAKNLLDTTDWQVKRISRETGHVNPKWFSHLFKMHTGLLPLEYRRKGRRQERPASSQ